jgi:hypothetical protein
LENDLRTDSPGTRPTISLFSRGVRSIKLRDSLSTIAAKLESSQYGAVGLLKWPFEKSEVHRLVAQINELKTSITVALTQANLDTSKETQKGVSETVQSFEDRNKSKIL